MKTIKNISRNNLSKSPKFPRISRNMPNLLKEWSEQQTNEAEKIIFEWLRFTEFWVLSRGAEKETKTFRNRVWGKCEEILGLAYTSSSSLTALYINNVTLHAPVEACALDLMDALHWAEFPPVYTVRAFAYDGVSVWALVENSDDERDYFFYNITNPAERDAQTLRALYALEIAKIFPDLKMIDYYTKRLSNVVLIQHVNFSQFARMLSKQSASELWALVDRLTREEMERTTYINEVFALPEVLSTLFNTLIPYHSKGKINIMSTELFDELNRVTTEWLRVRGFDPEDSADFNCVLAEVVEP